MYSSFWGLIYSNTNKKHGTLIGFIAFGVSLILWLFTPQTVISLGLVFFIIIFFIILTIIFCDAAYEIFKKHEEVSKDFEDYKNSIRVSPDIISVKTEENVIIILLRPSKFFSENMIVSLYYDDGGYEKLIGSGTVVNIQESGIIQVEFDNPLKKQKDILEKLIVENVNILNKTLIKPHISKRILEIIQNEDEV